MEELMTYAEYKDKLDKLASSDAPTAIKAVAIESLMAKYESRNTTRILASIEEARSEEIDYD